MPCPPVLLIIFKRPRSTRVVMEAIRKAAPSRLYIAADGPRPEREGEAELCEAARKVALEVDWPCEVKTLFRSSNVGLGINIPDGLDWFFTHEEEGIILEDDILPTSSFFPFCKTLLEYYRNIPEVVTITGNNFHTGLRYGHASYFFSRFHHCWGWATWRRAWGLYRQYENLQGVEEFIQNRILHYISQDAIPWWIDAFNRFKVYPYYSWAIKFEYAILKTDSLVVTPQVNMAKQMGYGDDSANFPEKCLWHDLPLEDIWNIHHPDQIVHCVEADKIDSSRAFGVACATRENCLNEVLRCLKRGELRGAKEMFFLMSRFFGKRKLFSALIKKIWR